MAQGIEHLPSKCQALSSNTSTAKKKKSGVEEEKGKYFGIKIVCIW
jgi:hypothetical protein